MPDRAIRVALLLIFALGICGCALIHRGNRQTVEVVTDPDAATLVVNGKTYTTPAKVLMSRKKSYDVTLTKEGYQGIHFQLKPRWDAGGAGAVAFDAIVPGGSVLFIVDTLAGAAREFNKIATIKLPPATNPSTQPITLYEHKGRLYNKAEYDQKVEEDKLFSSKKKKKGKKSAATQPATTQPTS
jgi:hypothetical protein